MTQIKKYNFDHSFDIYNDGEAIIELKQSELDTLKSAAYADGKNAALNEQREFLEQEVLKQLLMESASFDEKLQYYHDQLLENFAGLHLKILKKLFPILIEHAGQNEIASFIKSILGQLQPRGDLNILLSPKLYDQLKEKLNEDIKSKGLNCEVSPSDNSTIHDHYCEISWQKGKAIKSMEALLSSIEEITKIYFPNLTLNEDITETQELENE